MKPFYSALIVFAALISCNSNEITDSKDVTQDKIFQYYNINYKEGEDKVEVLSQFRIGSVTGPTIILNKPAHVSFDGNHIKVDSSTALGAFYRIFTPVKDFYGSHSFEYMDMDKNIIKNDFLFEKFSLFSPSDSSVSDKPFILKIKSSPLQADDRIEITATDSDSTFKVIHTSKDTASSILIPDTEIKRQKQQYLTMEAVLFRNIPLTHNSIESGLMEIRYVLKPFRLKLRD